MDEEPHSEILYLVPRTDHEQIIESGEVVECGHAKPRPGIGSGQVGHPFARPLHQRGSERAGERIVRRRQVGMCRLCIGITFRQPADVLPGPVHLCLYLMDRQVTQSVLRPVIAASVETTAESIPPETPTTNPAAPVPSR